MRLFPILPSTTTRGDFDTTQHVVMAIFSDTNSNPLPNQLNFGTIGEEVMSVATPVAAGIAAIFFRYFGGRALEDSTLGHEDRYNILINAGILSKMRIMFEILAGDARSPSCYYDALWQLSDARTWELVKISR